MYFQICTYSYHIFFKVACKRVFVRINENIFWHTSCLLALTGYVQCVLGVEVSVKIMPALTEIISRSLFLNTGESFLQGFKELGEMT